MLSNETEINPYCIIKTSVMEKKEKSVGTSNSLDPAHSEETIIGSVVCSTENIIGSDVSSPETIIGSEVCSLEIVPKPSDKINLASPVEVHPRIKRLSRQETDIDEPVFQWKLSSPPPRRCAQHSRGKIG